MDISQISNSRVCIVLHGETYDGLESMVFIFDLKSGENTTTSSDAMISLTMEPTVRLDWEHFHEPAVCVIGSKLYVFGGYRKHFSLQNFHLITDGKAVYTFDLFDGISNLKLEKKMMRMEAETMNHSKVWPKATVTPDELYDPHTRIWRPLPNLPVTQAPDHRFEVLAFTFIKTSVFSVRTEVGIFSLDLKSPEKNWKMSGFRGDECIPGHWGDRYVVIGRQICLIPYRAFDIRVRGTRPRRDVGGAQREDVFATLEYTFPNMLAFPRGYSSRSAGMALLDHEEGKGFSVCLLEAAVNDETKNVEVMLQVYYTDLPTCLKELSACRKKKVKEHSMWWKRKKESLLLPETSRVLTLKFVVREGPHGTESASLTSFSFVV